MDNKNNKIINLPAQSLEYKDIRKNFEEFLKADPQFKDFNFEASGISTQINMLSYNTHMIGMYVKMLLDESFIDSAHTRQAHLSHAKKTGYTPKGKRAARAEIELQITMDAAQQPVSDSVMIPKGTSFASSNNQQDSRLFQIPDDVVAKSKTIDPITGKLTYSTKGFTVYEGLYQKWRFLVDSSQENQRFVIKDYDIDVDTLRVFVRPNPQSAQITEFKPARYIDDVKGESPVYYLTTNEEGFYQIFFGNGVFGIQPDNGNSIEVTYVATNGESGNGAKEFKFNAPAADLSMDYHVGNFNEFKVITHAAASGGMESESVESMKFTIPSHYRRQNRLLTESDYKGILLEEFRNIDSMNVWGGEEHIFKTYGKIFCALKPKHAVALSDAAKSDIRKAIIKDFGIVGSDVVFIDPEYVDVHLTTVIDFDRKNTSKTQGEVKADVINRVTDYNKTKLNKFQQMLSDHDLVKDIRQGEVWYRSVFCQKTISKKSIVLYRSSGIVTLNFGNKLEKEGIYSDIFRYGDNDWRYEYQSGKLYMVCLTDKEQKPIEDKAATVDLENGVIRFKFPEFAHVPDYEKRNGYLTWHATPAYPDIYTNLNNIVRIVDTEVIFK